MRVVLKKRRMVHPPVVNEPEVIQAVVGEPNLKLLSKIRKVKKFVLGVAEGKTMAIAAKEAGATYGMMNSPVARQLIKALIDQEFGDNKYVDKLKELWNATDVRAGKFGTYVTPNWEAQVKALDRVGKLRGFDVPDAENTQPQSITIQVVGEANVQVSEVP
jgi:hypothetical protein